MRIRTLRPVLALAFLVMLSVWAASASIAFEFNASGDAEGWAPWHNVGAFTVAGGTLRADITGFDPYIGRSGIAVDAAANPYVVIRMKLSMEGTCQLFWATDGGQLSEDSSRRHLWLRDAEWHTYVFTFRDDRDWSGVLTQFRLDPPDGPGEAVRLQWVKLLAPQG